MAKRTDKATIIEEYEAAYVRANPGHQVQVTSYTPGWYRINQFGGITGARRSYRISQFPEMTERLNAKGDRLYEKLRPKREMVDAERRLSRDRYYTVLRARSGRSIVQADHVAEVVQST